VGGIKIYFIIIILVLSETLFAQSEKILADYKIFHSIGISPFLDLIQTPIQSVSVMNGFLSDQVTPRMVNSFSQSRAYSFGTLVYDLRLNIKEISDDFAFGVAIKPSIGLSFTEPVNELNGFTGLGHIQVAAMSSVVFGQMATIKSMSDYGLSFATGFEFNKIGIINRVPSTVFETLPNNWWFMPNFSLGLNTYRRGSPVELNIKVGMGFRRYYNLDNLGGSIDEKIGRANSFRFTIFYKL